MTSHSVQDLLNHQAFLSLPPPQLQFLYDFLLDPSVTYQQCKALNPATLLLTPHQSRTPLHSCTETLDLTLYPFSHILDQYIMGAPNWFIDGNSHKTSPSQAGYAIIEGYHDDHSCFPP
jgi:hypothetical protein